MNRNVVAEAHAWNQPAPLPPEQSGTPSAGRVLLMKFGSIGDVIMTIPAAAALYAQGFAIDWVVGEPLAPLLRLYPWIHVISVDEASLLRGTYPSRLRTWAGLAQALRRRVRESGRYDEIVTLYYDRRYRWLTSWLPTKRRVSLSRHDRNRALLPGRHHVDEYARILLSRLDKVNDFQLAPVPPPTIPLPPTRANQAGAPRVVLVPAGARNVLRDDALRRWPVANYRALASSLLAAGCEVLLAGGPDDRWASAHFADLATGESARFLDLIGKLSLVETLGLLASAQVTVSHDTGPLHMAGLTETAIVTIFGPTDPHGRLPRRSNAVAFWGGEGFSCRPCYDGQNYAPCPENACMAQITPKMVETQVIKLIQARAEHQDLPPAVLLPEPSAFVQIRPVLS